MDILTAGLKNRPVNKLLLFIGNDIREYFDILTGFLRLFYIN
jgi:hypothetical protein